MVMLLLLQTLEVFVFCELLGSQLSIGLYFAIAIAGSCSGCSYCCCSVPVALKGKDVVTIILIENMLVLLLDHRVIAIAIAGLSSTVSLSACHDCHSFHCRISF